MIRSLFVSVFLCSCMAVFCQTNFSSPNEILNLDEFYEGPSHVVAVDFDLDGRQDYIIASSDFGNVGWFRNEGDFNFTDLEIVLDDVAGIKTLDMNDFDNDGDVDILIGNEETEQLRLYLNDGFNNFNNSVGLIFNAKDLADVEVVDLDQDGDLDVLAAHDANNNSKYKLFFIKNSGTASFSRIEIDEYFQYTSTIETADLDNDGDIDILLNRPAVDNLEWLRNNGSENFSSPITIDGSLRNSWFIKTADLDADGDQDIVKINRASEGDLSWFENTGNGTFEDEFVIAEDISGVRDLHLKDVNQDNNIDIVLGAVSDKKLVRFEGLGNGEFEARYIESPNFTRPSLIDIGDFNGDNLPEIVAVSYPNNMASLYANIGNGDFDTPQIIKRYIQHIKQILSFDFELDGDVDVIALNHKTLTFFENKGDQSYKPAITMDIGFDNVAVELQKIDFDDDGYDDLFFLYVGGDSIVWLNNNQNGGFDMRSIKFEGIRHHLLKVVDFDYDNDLDLIVRTTPPDIGAFYLENIGNNTFGELIPMFNYSGNYLEPVDFDNDGDLDILTSRFQISQGYVNWIHENDGNNIFFFDAAVPQGFKFPKPIDLDADGLIDLVVRSRSDDKISWFKNLGGLEFGSEIIIADDIDGVIDFQVADIDNDSDLDIVFSSYTNLNDEQKDEFGYIENMGNQEFGSKQIIDLVSTEENCIHMSDMDIDGDLDIVLAQYYNFIGLDWYENLLAPKKINSLVFYDSNQNGIIDSSEGGLGQIPFILNPIDFNYFTNDSGYLETFLLENGESLVLNVDSLWTLTTGYDSIDLLSYDTIDIDTFLFGLHPNVLINDLTVNITSSFTRCGRPTLFKIIVTNTGTSILSGNVSTTNMEYMNYVQGSATPAPISIEDNDLTWEFNELFPGQRFEVSLNCIVDSITNLGNSVCLNAESVLLVKSDETSTYYNNRVVEEELIKICHCTGSGQNPYILLDVPLSAADGLGNHDHSNHLCDIIPIGDRNGDGQIDVQDCLNEQDALDTIIIKNSFKSLIRCSFDPNDKSASPKGESEEAWTLAGQDIIYTIRFQNTGNDTAFYVEIVDTLDENLDVSTFEFISSSHSPLEISIEPIEEDLNSILRFRFNEIQLPDSSTNELASNGFIVFSIAPLSSVEDSTIITNDAAIVFDFNEPIITNEVHHTLVYSIPDYRRPVAVCNEVVTTNLNEDGVVMIDIAQIDFGSSDNVGIVNSELSSENFTCIEVGDNEVTLFVYDAEGNTDSCSTIVKIIDSLLPKIECKDILVNIENQEEIILAPVDLIASMDDNCDIDTINIEKDNFTIADVGMNEIAIDIIDVNGNISTCTSIVEVKLVSNVLENKYETVATLSPNPFDVTTTLSFSKSLDFRYDVRIYDATGKELKAYIFLDKKELLIENDGFSDGLYILNIYKTGESKVLSSLKLLVY